MNSTSKSVSQSMEVSPGAILLPLALAQFLCSFAGTSTNVAISVISEDLGTTISGVQLAITLFTLTMAALMIPGSKLTDILGRTFDFRLGLIIYGIGAIIASISQSLPIFIGGYSFFEGVGTALLIPPVYILATVLFVGLKERARAFGAISAAAGVGSAAGPLIGGMITSATSWRVTFLVQALLVLVIIYLSRRIPDPGIQGAKPKFNLLGAVISAVGLFFIVIGILQAQTYGFFKSAQPFMIGNTVLIPQGGISPVWIFVLIGALFLFWFIRHIISMEKAGKTPLISFRMFQNRTSNLGLVTQIMQWLGLQGLAFVISAFVQTVWGYNPIQTGLVLTPATIGVILGSLPSGRFAQRRAQAWLIRGGFIFVLVGLVLLLILVPGQQNVWSFAPGLFLGGIGVGIMLTSSVNVVQSSFPDEDQGEISGLSRSVSNLGSSLGVAIAGTVIISPVVSGNQGYAVAVIVLAVAAVIGLIAAFFIPVIKPKPPVPQEAKAVAKGD